MRKKNKRIRDLNNSKLKSMYQQKGRGQGECRKSMAILKITKKYYLLLFTYTLTKSMESDSLNLHITAGNSKTFQTENSFLAKWFSVRLQPTD